MQEQSLQVEVVYGAPASGKTTYVKEHRTTNDIVYDFDDLMQVLSGLPYQQTNDHLREYVLDIRKAIIQRLKNETNLQKAYIITTFLSDSLMNELEGLNVQYIQMQTDKETCLKRIDNSNRFNKEKLIDVTLNWFNKYTNQEISYKTKESKRQFYNSTAWKKLRLKALERDNSECIWCAQEGRVTTQYDAVLEVDHIKEIEYYPELALELDNLRTLCNTCHNRRHNRFDGREKKWDDEMW